MRERLLKLFRCEVSRERLVLAERLQDLNDLDGIDGMDFVRRASHQVRVCIGQHRIAYDLNARTGEDAFEVETWNGRSYDLSVVNAEQLEELIQKADEQQRRDLEESERRMAKWSTSLENA